MTDDFFPAKAAIYFVVCGVSWITFFFSSFSSFGTSSKLRSRIVSAIHFAPVSDGDDEDLQNAVMDFVNHPVITDANPPRVAAFEFFHVRRARVGFQSGQ